MCDDQAVSMGRGGDGEVDLISLRGRIARQQYLARNQRYENRIVFRG